MNTSHGGRCVRLIGAVGRGQASNTASSLEFRIPSLCQIPLAPQSRTYASKVLPAHLHKANDPLVGLRRFSVSSLRFKSENDAEDGQPAENAEEAEAIDHAIGTMLPPLRAGWHADPASIEHAESSDKATIQLSSNQQMIDKVKGDFHSFDIVRLLNVQFDIDVYLRQLRKAHDALGKSKQTSPALFALYQRMEEQLNTAREMLEKIRTQLQQLAPAAGYDIFQIGSRLDPGLRSRYYGGISVFVGGSALLFYGLWKGIGAVLGLGAKSVEENKP